MEQKFFDAVFAAMDPILSENGVTADGNIRRNDSRAFKVEYNGDKKVFELYSAAVTDGEIGEYTLATSYLFDEASTEKDATAVGIDFSDTALSLLGVSTRRTRSAGDVALPGKTGGETPGIDDLCNKLLAIFPKHKDSYKEHVQENGEFLYVHFLLDTVAVELRDLLENSTGDKKLKKIFDSIDDLYVKGDRTVSDTIVVVVIGGAIKGDPALTERTLSLLDGHQHLKNAVYNISKRTHKDKKLKEMYGIA